MATSGKIISTMVKIATLTDTQGTQAAGQPQ